MGKPAKFDYTQDAQSIAWAVLNGVTSIQNLHAFRNRVPAAQGRPTGFIRRRARHFD